MSPAVEALLQAEDALVDPIALTGGSHLLNAPPWDAEKEKVSLPPKARCGILLTECKDTTRSIRISFKSSWQGYPISLDHGVQCLAQGPTRVPEGYQ